MKKHTFCNKEFGNNSKLKIYVVNYRSNDFKYIFFILILRIIKVIKDIAGIKDKMARTIKLFFIDLFLQIKIKISKIIKNKILTLSIPAIICKTILIVFS